MQNKEVKSNASELHRKVYNIVKECYPKETILQEKTIKIDGKTLFIDIYVPRLKVGVECNGRQHYKFTQFFHGDAQKFKQQVENDRLKKEYCEIEGITLVNVRYDEIINRELLEDKIVDALKRGTK